MNEQVRDPHPEQPASDNLPLETPENLPDVARAEQGENLDWKRAHPLSPLVRVWLLFLGLSLTIGRDALGTWRENDWKLPEQTDGALSFLGSFAIPATFLAFFLLALLPNIWSWAFTRYAVDEQKVYLNRGLIFRSSTEARLDKVQAIDIYQPFVARLLGLAELKFEVADGSSTLLAVRFLKKQDAEELRTLLLSQVRALQEPKVSAETSASVVTDPEAENQPGVPVAGAASTPVGVLGEETPIFEVPALRNFLSVFLGSIFLPLILVFAGLALYGLILGDGLSMRSLIGSAGFFGLLMGLMGQLNGGHRFRASATDKSLKLRYGLTSTTSQTVPLGRIQAISVTQPLFWRIFGWFKVTASIAGYGTATDGEAKNQRNVLLPVGTGQQLLDLLPYLIKEQELGRVDGAQLQAALEGKGDSFGFTLNPASSRWFNWFTWKRNGFAVTPAYLLVRSGFFVRRLRVIPLDKVQSAQTLQGPLDRLFNLAQVDMGTVSTNQLDNRIENVSPESARYLAALLVSTR